MFTNPKAIFSNNAFDTLYPLLVFSVLSGFFEFNQKKEKRKNKNKNKETNSGLVMLKTKPDFSVLVLDVLHYYSVMQSFYWVHPVVVNMFLFLLFFMGTFVCSTIS